MWLKHSSVLSLKDSNFLCEHVLWKYNLNNIPHLPHATHAIEPSPPGLCTSTMLLDINHTVHELIFEMNDFKCNKLGGQ